ncbi:MAG TPA: hypothetical protein VHO26_02120 [Propionibacteriaceae bacterium]|nr:hypothetical protein [Propionibacteriaceae bacterium]
MGDASDLLVEGVGVTGVENGGQAGDGGGPVVGVLPDPDAVTTAVVGVLVVGLVGWGEFQHLGVDQAQQP